MLTRGQHSWVESNRESSQNAGYGQASHHSRVHNDLAHRTHSEQSEEHEYNESESIEDRPAAVRGEATVCAQSAGAAARCVLDSTRIVSLSSSDLSGNDLQRNGVALLIAGFGGIDYALFLFCGSERKKQNQLQSFRSAFLSWLRAR